MPKKAEVLWGEPCIEGYGLQRYGHLPVWTLSQYAEGPHADVLSLAVPWNHGPTWSGEGEAPYMCTETPSANAEGPSKVGIRELGLQRENKGIFGTLWISENQRVAYICMKQDWPRVLCRQGSGCAGEQLGGNEGRPPDVNADVLERASQWPVWGCLSKSSTERLTLLAGKRLVCQLQGGEDV